MDAVAMRNAIGKYPIDPQNPIFKGKTKSGFSIDKQPALVLIISRDDVTKKDGRVHCVIPGKGILSNEISANGFRMLRKRGYGDEISFQDQDCTNSSVHYFTHMVKFEVVVRRHAFGSYLKRHKQVRPMEILDLPVEFYLKTNGGRVGQVSIQCDDPLIEHSSEHQEVLFYYPDRPRDLVLGPMFRLIESEIASPMVWEHLPDMKRMAINFFLEFEDAWAGQGCTLIDFKFEFGFHLNRLILSDVVDNESCRVIENDTGEHLDKEVFRNLPEDPSPEQLEQVMKAYRRAHELSSRFEQA